MKVSDVCKNYFNGFQEVSDFRKNDSSKNVLAVLKVISYFTVVVPLFFAIAYGAASLYGRVSKKQDLSDQEKRIDETGKKTLLKKDPTEEKVSTPLENNLEPAATIPPANQSDDVANSTQRVEEKTEDTVESSLQQKIASLSPATIEGIATALIGDTMDRLNIDIEVSSIFTLPPDLKPGTVYAVPKKYNKESLLMKFLLPLCSEILTKSFANPKEFVEKGIVFEFLNSSKTGLLDNIEDSTLNDKIVAGMREHSTFSMTVKATMEKVLWIEITQSQDEKFVARQTTTVMNLLETAEEGVL